MKEGIVEYFDNIVLEPWLHLKPEYLTHEFISGNKWRKLKYNIKEAKSKDFKTLLTFGGAFSNHIAAVAYAGCIFGFETIGVIRGEELESKELNETLSFAKANGMKFKFVTREDYKRRGDSLLLELEDEFEEFYHIPEGGTNSLAIRGCEEILNTKDNHYDYICCCVGTGGTISGIINNSNSKQTVLGFPALKGDFLQKDIIKFAKNSNWKLVTDYNFGGYAKVNSDLISFINDFKLKYKVPLDPIYTGKMMYGVFKLKEQGFFKDEDKVLVIHTGGLQGIKGMNSFLERKKLPLII